MLDEMDSKPFIQHLNLNFYRMNLKQQTAEILSQTITELYNYSPERLEIQNTRKEFEGEYTLVTFPLIKELKKSPEQIGQEIGNALLEKKTDFGF